MTKFKNLNKLNLPIITINNTNMFWNKQNQLLLINCMIMFKDTKMKKQGKKKIKSYS